MESVRRYSAGWLIGATCLMSCCNLFAQANLAGAVVDPDGSAVANVEVLLRTLQGAPIPGGSTTADSQGHFHFPQSLLAITSLIFRPLTASTGTSARFMLAPRLHELRFQLTAPVVTQDVTVAPETNEAESGPFLEPRPRCLPTRSRWRISRSSIRTTSLTSYALSRSDRCRHHGGRSLWMVSR